ncbi:MAG: Yip1 family protein [Alphaproteobacteria bacterium]
MQAQAIIARVQQILLNPQAAWAQIDGESAGVQSLYVGYIIPLAAIPAIARFLGLLLSGLGFLLLQAIVSFAFSLGAVYVFALIIDYLAPQFGAQKNFNQAFKVAAYAPTAAWVAGAFNIIPGIGGIISVIGALYSLYLLFLGLPVLMKPPSERATTYTLVAIICAVIVGAIFGAVASRLFMPPVVIVTH